MTKYLTINTANKNKNELLNELAIFGWELQTDRVISFEDNIDIFGTYDDDDDKPLVELTLIFKNGDLNSDKLYELSLKYIELKNKNIRAKNSSIAKLVTGLVFGSMFTVTGIAMLLIGVQIDPNYGWITGLLFLAFGLPAYPLCILGIIFKKRNAKRGVTDTVEEIEQLKREARSLR